MIFVEILTNPWLRISLCLLRWDASMDLCMHRGCPLGHLILDVPGADCARWSPLPQTPATPKLLLAKQRLLAVVQAVSDQHLVQLDRYTSSKVATLK